MNSKRERRQSNERHHLVQALSVTLAIAGALLGSGPATAQTWPSRPITMIVPFPPGPALDLVARQVGAKIADPLGQPIVVENRTGANGAIGSNAVARAAPDGYTLLAATAGTHVTAPYLMKNLPYDPVKDFTPIVAAVEPVTCLAVAASLPVNSVPELIARVRALLRRASPERVADVLVHGEIELDREKKRVSRAGRTIDLGPTEYRLLEFLMERPGRVFSRTQLLDAVWGSEVYIDERTVDVHVGRLRKALNRGREADPIRTVRGAGYALDDRFGRSAA